MGYSELPSRAAGVANGQVYKPIAEQHASVVIHNWREEESSYARIANFHNFLVIITLIVRGCAYGLYPPFS